MKKLFFLILIICSVNVQSQPEYPQPIPQPNPQYPQPGPNPNPEPGYPNPLNP